MLTVVVPTVPGREQLLSRCLWSIQQQPGDIELIVAPGEAGLGQKVNAAVKVATGTHLTVVDDDDYLDGAYMDCVMPLLGYLFVGMQMLQLLDGAFYGISETRGDKISTKWTRRAFGPCPKAVTALDVWRHNPLDDDYLADRRWSVKVQPMVAESRAFVDRPIYVYDWWPSASAFEGKGAARDVGTWPVDWSAVTTLEVPACK